MFMCNPGGNLCTDVSALCYRGYGGCYSQEIALDSDVYERGKFADAFWQVTLE